MNPIPEERLGELPPTESGTPVRFQGAGLCHFFTFFFREPWWVKWWGKREYQITFRVHPGRRPVDRFLVFWVYERDAVGMSPFVKFLYAKKAPAKNLRNWLKAKYWLYPQQGYPTDPKWLRHISLKEATAEERKQEDEGTPNNYRLSKNKKPYKVKTK